MKRILIIWTILSFSFTSNAEYRPLELYEMIIKAEKIVYGTIIELDSSSFTLNIEGSLTSDTGIIKVGRFSDWSCASRWTKYKVGQRLFLFLTAWNGEFISMSGGNEGEHPILNNSIYIHGFTIPIPPPPPPSGKTWSGGIFYFETEHYDIYGGEYFGIQWNLNKFIEAVSFIRNCFDFTYGRYHNPTNWQIKCDNSELERMSKKSKFVNWVNNESTKKYER